MIGGVSSPGTLTRVSLDCLLCSSVRPAILQEPCHRSGHRLWIIDGHNRACPLTLDDFGDTANIRHDDRLTVRQSAIKAGALIDVTQAKANDTGPMEERIESLLRQIEP